MLTGCDEGMKMTKPVMGDDPMTKPTMDPEVPVALTVKEAREKRGVS